MSSLEDKDVDKQLSGRDLDRAIAKALGYSVTWDDNLQAAVTTLSEERIYTNRTFANVSPENLIAGSWDAVTPRFHADANAVLEVCVERKWRLSFGRNLKKNQPYAAIEWDDDDWDFVTVNGATPQEAAARALLAALRHVGS